jgi:hypothetical protein
MKPKIEPFRENALIDEAAAAFSGDEHLAHSCYLGARRASTALRQSSDHAITYNVQAANSHLFTRAVISISACLTFPGHQSVLQQIWSEIDTTCRVTTAIHRNL